MLPENVATLTEARARLFEIGGVLMDQYERGARFLLASGWSFEIEFDRYSTGFMTSIVDHRSGEAYVVFVLMEVFEELLGRRYGQATLENQVAFIDKEKASLFGDPKWYADAYTAAVSSY